MEILHNLSLENLISGAVNEAFQHEFNKVLANISDPNTRPKDKRKLTIELTFAPSEDRYYAGMEAKIKSTCGGQHNETLISSINISGNSSQIVATERITEQQSLFTANL